LAIFGAIGWKALSLPKRILMKIKKSLWLILVLESVGRWQGRIRRFEHEYRHMNVMAHIIRGAAVEQVADETVAVGGHSQEITVTTFDPSDDLIRWFTVS
jgi:hypothetical protein